MEDLKIYDVDSLAIKSKLFIAEFQEAECEYISNNCDINNSLQKCILYWDEYQENWYVCGDLDKSPDGGHFNVAEKCGMKRAWCISFNRNTLKSIDDYMQFSYFKAIGKTYTLFKKDEDSDFELILNESFEAPSINDYSIF
jgi:hypothetical protein